MHNKFSLPDTHLDQFLALSVTKTTDATKLLDHKHLQALKDNIIILNESISILQNEQGNFVDASP